MTKFVDITPHVSLLRKVGQSGHSVADAIAELVDNGLDARIPGQPVRVEVELDHHNQVIRVFDDGHGMSGPGLARALVLAESDKREGAIGRFGLGLKTACTSLGERFEITSAVAGAHYAHIASYDADQFVAEGRWRLPIRRLRKTWDHGTLVEAHCHRLYPALASGLHKNLGWTFRHFLLDGVLELLIDGEPVRPAEYAVDPASVMPIDGHLGGRRVRGWAGLLRESSQRGWYGFALVRHRRIVRRHEKLGFQAHPQTARVVGELHLDDFDTNNLKTDFIRETEGWRELEQWISTAIEPVVAASRALAHAGLLDLKIKAQIAAEREQHSLEGVPLNLPGEPSLAADRRDSSPVAVAVGEVHLQHIFSRLGVERSYATIEVEARDGEADVTVVRTNVDHAAANQISDRSGWACHNIAEAVVAHLPQEHHPIELKSIILSQLLNQRGLRRALQESARVVFDSGAVATPAVS